MAVYLGLLSPLALLLAAPGVCGELGEGVCAGGAACSPDGGGADGHYWPQAFGRVGSYGRSAYAGPRNLTTATYWSWTHPKGRYAKEFFAVVIDDKRNLYVSTVAGMYKLSPGGRLLWEQSGHVRSSAALLGGLLYYIDFFGFAVALDMESGHKVWSTTVSERIGVSATVGAHEGIVIFGSHSSSTSEFCDDTKVTALNATTGEKLWNFDPDARLWVFAALFTGNGSVVFQDQIGGVYHVGLDDGHLIWKAGYQGHWTETWTDGSPLLADGVVYAVHNSHPQETIGKHTPGDLSAYRLSDGHLLWRARFPHPTNSQPLLVRSADGDNFTVVMPIGMQAVFGAWFLILSTVLGTLASTVPCTGALTVGLWLILTAFSRLCLRDAAKPRFLLYPRRLARQLARLSAFILAVLPLLAVIANFPGPETWNRDWPSELRALDAATGGQLWSWQLPAWRQQMQRGSGEFFLLSAIMYNDPQGSIPTPFGTGAVDATETMYLAYQDGKVYTVADIDSDGTIDPMTEVTSRDAGASFDMPGIALAPGLMAVTSLDGVLHVFQA